MSTNQASSDEEQEADEDEDEDEDERGFEWQRNPAYLRRETVGVKIEATGRNDPRGAGPVFCTLVGMGQ